MGIVTISTDVSMTKMLIHFMCTNLNAKMDLLMTRHPIRAKKKLQLIVVGTLVLMVGICSKIAAIFFSARNNKPGTFTQALSACQEMDAYLVEIESKAEDDFIIEKALSLASGNGDGLDYWIGAQDSDGDGVWNWATSGKPLVYTNWWTDHGNLNSTCVQLLKNGRTSPKKLDSFYWTMAAGNYNQKDCKDGDNSIICEKNPDAA